MGGILWINLSLNKESRPDICVWVFAAGLLRLKGVKYHRNPEFFQAAILAKKLDHKSISVMEFGVAGGHGLLSLEKCANVIGKALAINIEVYGFDTGMGLPAPDDYRDLSFMWKKGLYKMNVEKLEKRLTNAKLVIGDIRETSKTFFEKYKPAPIEAVMFDMDFYSSTIASFDLFNADAANYLPRIFTYFDDIFVEHISEYTGERLAINEFNNSHEKHKFSLEYSLQNMNKKETWYQKIFVLHLFDHKEYNYYVKSHAVGALKN